MLVARPFFYLRRITASKPICDCCGKAATAASIVVSFTNNNGVFQFAASASAWHILDLVWPVKKINMCHTFWLGICTRRPPADTAFGGPSAS